MTLNGKSLNTIEEVELSYSKMDIQLTQTKEKRLKIEVERKKLNE